MEQLNKNTSQLPNDNGWSEFPPFQGNMSAEQNDSTSETVKDTPDYLSDIDPARRREIIDSSAEMTRVIPGAMIFGGNANRILYEVYTGKTMFVLDEPTGTMDPITRVIVTDSILKARKELEQTFIIISHDMDFVLDVCDRAALMRGGKLLDEGTPEEIVEQLTPDEKEDMLKG